MIILSIIVLIGLICSCYYIKTDSISKKIVLTYTIIMSLAIIISMFNPVGLFEVSNYTYFLLILNISLISITILLVGKYRFNREESNEIKDYKEIIHSKVFYVIQICESIILIYYLIKYFIIISNLPVTQIRIARYSLLFDSAFETLFYNYIVTGIITVSTLIFAVMVVRKEILNISFLLISINIILYTLIGFGRMTIFTTLLSIFSAFIILREVEKRISLKNIIIILIILIIIFVCCSFMITMRMKHGGDNIFEKLIEAIKEQFEQIFVYFLGRNENFGYIYKRRF